MHDSYTPLGGLVPLFNMQTGEVIFGGVGAGLYGMLLYAILAVFIAGLMVGRTPEYLGKKIEQKEVKMAMLALIATAASILVFTAISSVLRLRRRTATGIRQGPTTGNLNNGGPHGLREILYAYTSGTGNNGSAFAGISANTPWYNLTIGLAMLIGRFLFMVPLLAVAGSLAARRQIPVTSGTLPTHGRCSSGCWSAPCVIVGALTFFPALSLGPIVEHFLMHEGQALLTGMPALELAMTVTTPHRRRRRSRDRRRSDVAAAAEAGASRPLFDPEIVRRAIARFVRQAEPGHAAARTR